MPNPESLHKPYTALQNTPLYAFWIKFGVLKQVRKQEPSAAIVVLKAHMESLLA